MASFLEQNVDVVVVSVVVVVVVAAVRDVHWAPGKVQRGLAQHGPYSGLADLNRADFNHW